jgi:hypothetical protein
MEPVESLRVFPDGKMPADAKDESGVIAMLIEHSMKQLDALKRAKLDDAKAKLLPAWQHTMQVEFPERDLIVQRGETKKIGEITRHTLHVGRQGRGDRLPIVMFTPAKDELRMITVLAHPQGKVAHMDAEGLPTGVAKELLARKQSVVLLDTFLTGELTDETAAKARRPTSGFFTVYNRTEVQERVQDLVTACAFAQTHGKGRSVVLCGSGRAGLWALLAAPAADAVVADCAQLDLRSDAALMEPDLFAPGLRKIGAFEAAAVLAVPIASAYASAKKPGALRREAKALDPAAQAEWIAQLKLK